MLWPWRRASTGATRGGGGRRAWWRACCASRWRTRRACSSYRWDACSDDSAADCLAAGDAWAAVLPELLAACRQWAAACQPCIHSTVLACSTPPTTLQAAIDSVRTGQGVIANPAVERQLQLWMAALVSGDAEATTHVFALVQAAGGDLQQMRQLLRQAQQVEAPPAAADEQAEDGSSSSSSNGSSAAAAASSSPAAASRPTAKARAASKQLRKLLQPLAVAQVGEADAEEE